MYKQSSVKYKYQQFMSIKGRPSNQKTPIAVHQQRTKKAENVKQFWSEHKLTLIAYQAQYIYSKKPSEHHQIRRQEGQVKKKGARKKVDLRYQSAFLGISPQQSEEIKIQSLIKEYQSLNDLFNNEKDESMLIVRQFIQVLLELKHSAIVKQFCEIYNIIIKEIQKVQFSQFEKQEPRFQFLEGVKQKILAFIEKNREKFPKFISYLASDGLQTKKLILVQSYCILAEKFNFNINEFYSQAFCVNYDSNPSKKVKKSQ